ncbi:CARDB domain-containing protein [Chloroflexota bacterium]
MAKRTGRVNPLWIGCGVVFLGAIILSCLLGVYWYTPLFNPLPTIRIIQPGQTLEIEAGQVVVLIAQGDSSNGIDYINFLENDIPINQHKSDQSQQESLDVVFPWYSSQPGIHKLSVIAYDNSGRASSTDWVLVVVNPKGSSTISQAVSQRVDADNQQTPSDSGDQAQGGSGDGDEQADPDQIQPDPDANNNQPPSSNGSQPLGGSVNGEVQVILDRVLQNGEEDEEFPIDLPDQPQDEPPEITTFDIQAAQAGNQVNGTYRVNAADDLGLTYLTFFIANLDNPLNPTSTQHLCGGERTCAADGSFQLPQGGWVLSAQAVDTSGQVSPMHARQIHVLEGEDPAAYALDLEAIMLQLDPLDAQMPWDEVYLIYEEPTDKLGTPRIAEYRCSGRTVVLEVPYAYLSDHGDEVYVGAIAESGNTVVAAGHQRIDHNVGIAKFEMENIAEQYLVTEQLELHFMAAGGDYFYKETADMEIHWPIPKPDLAISSSTMDGESFSVEVQNVGCASVEGFNLRIHPQEGEDLDLFVEEYIPPGGTYTWYYMEPFGADLLSRGYTVTVDPDNAIEEINEDNNVYEQSPITNKGVQFYYLDIHSTSEQWPQDTDQGEFDFLFTAGNSWFNAYNWELTEGGHDMSIILYPTLEWNQDLYIEVKGFENDLFDNDYVGKVKFPHPYDIHQEYTWKKNGEKCMLSDKKEYTICWRWLVE